MTLCPVLFLAKIPITRLNMLSFSGCGPDSRNALCATAGTAYWTRTAVYNNVLRYCKLPFVGFVFEKPIIYIYGVHMQQRYLGI